MNKAVLSWRLKIGSDRADVTCNGRESQVRASATWNARLPTMEKRIDGMISSSVDTDHSGSGLDVGHMKETVSKARRLQYGYRLLKFFLFHLDHSVCKLSFIRISSMEF